MYEQIAHVQKATFGLSTLLVLNKQCRVRTCPVILSYCRYAACCHAVCTLGSLLTTCHKDTMHFLPSWSFSALKKMTKWFLIATGV